MIHIGLFEGIGGFSEKQKQGWTIDLNSTIGANTGMKLQPAFVEYLMGYPEGWTDLSGSKPSETP